MKLLIGMMILMLSPIATLENIQAMNCIAPETVALSTEDQILDVLKDEGISDSLSHVILAQAKFESGNFTNRLTKDHNNPFAMKHPVKRRTTSLGRSGRAEGCKCFASYSDIRSATKDYIHYMNMIRAPKDTTLSGYITFLKHKGYFTENLNRYRSGVKRYYKLNPKKDDTRRPQQRKLLENKRW